MSLPSSSPCLYLSGTPPKTERRGKEGREGGRETGEGASEREGEKYREGEMYRERERVGGWEGGGVEICDIGRAREGHTHTFSPEYQPLQSIDGVHWMVGDQVAINTVSQPTGLFRKKIKKKRVERLEGVD